MLQTGAAFGEFFSFTRFRRQFFQFAYGGAQKFFFGGGAGAGGVGLAQFVFGFFPRFEGCAGFLLQPRKAAESVKNAAMRPRV